MKFTSKISKTEMTFLDTKVYKGVSFEQGSFLHEHATARDQQ